MCRETVLVRGATRLRVMFGSRGEQRSRRAAGVATGASARGVRATRRQVTSHVTRHPDWVAALAAHITLASMSVIASALNRAILLEEFSRPIALMASIRSAALRSISSTVGLSLGLKSLRTRAWTH